MAKITFDLLMDSEPFSSEDAKELRTVLSNKSLQRALGNVLVLAEGMDRLSACDLEGREGLHAALRQKGTVEGIRVAVQTLTDLAEEEDNEPTT